MIEANPSDQPVPMGTTVVLVCKVACSSYPVKYKWSCPNSACTVSASSRETPRYRKVSGNTLTVKVVDKSDAGEYRCTVNEGGNILSNSYTLAISGGYIYVSTD